MPATLQAISKAEYLLVQAALPGRPVRNVGVLLFDPANDRLYRKFLEEWTGVADEDDAEWLEGLATYIDTLRDELGGKGVLDYLEDSASNSLVLTNRETIQIGDFRKTLERLFSEHVQEEKIVPFVTHVPLYSLRAAATKFGDDMEVDQEGWVKGPGRVRLSKDMFVARVVGRSMEPKIPDGSLCLFRASVVGSRQGKLLLVEVRGATDSSAQFTIKRYTSQKIYAEDGSWHHDSIRLEPLNPEFQPLDLEEGQFRVIAEFVQVLDLN